MPENTRKFLPALL